MTIKNYIMRGGEDLNSPPIIAGFLPLEAQKEFDHWHVKLSQDDGEEESFIECPIDENNRLFIRVFWYEPSGQRPEPYYVGMLVPRSLYLEAGEYYRINRGLCNVSLSEIRRAVHSKASIEINTEWPLPLKIIGQPFDVLADWKKFGETGFHSNMNELLLSVSINMIDDWFSRLIIAANPDQLDPACHVVISRKKPFSSLTTTSHGSRSSVQERERRYDSADLSKMDFNKVDDSFDSTYHNERKQKTSSSNGDSSSFHKFEIKDQEPLPDNTFVSSKESCLKSTSERNNKSLVYLANILASIGIILGTIGVIKSNHIISLLANGSNASPNATFRNDEIENMKSEIEDMKSEIEDIKEIIKDKSDISDNDLIWDHIWKIEEAIKEFNDKNDESSNNTEPEKPTSLFSLDL